MRDLLLATCSQLPDGDEDAALLLDALGSRGISARWQAWTEPDAGWDVPTVLRSTWDYTTDRDAFLAWAASVPTLLNPEPVARWSSDKTYLAELASAGLPVVPTAAYPPGQAPDLPQDVEFVIKPSVGAGSRGCGRFEAGDFGGALSHAADLHGEGRTLLVQPYVCGVDEQGETALLYFGGVFSHAIAKGAMLPPATVYPSVKPAKGAMVSDGAELFVPERVTARSASEDELAVGDKAIAFIRERFGADLLYARVDVLPTVDGPVIGELELVEPSLFLGYAGGAADRFAAAVAAVL